MTLPLSITIDLDLETLKFILAQFKAMAHSNHLLMILIKNIPSRYQIKRSRKHGITSLKKQQQKKKHSQKKANREGYLN